MGGKTKILVVDDDPDIRDAVTTVLEAHEYQVVCAQDGVEALAKLKDEQPDLMVLDLLMPRMDGFAVCKELLDPRWRKYSNIPIIVFSSVKEQQSQRRYQLEMGLQLNVDDYVEKPIDPEMLIQRVEKQLRKKGKG